MVFFCFLFFNGSNENTNKRTGGTGRIANLSRSVSGRYKQIQSQRQTNPSHASFPEGS